MKDRLITLGSQDLAHYIDPLTAKQEFISDEKLGYLRYLEKLVGQLDFSKGKSIAVLGVGQGFELRYINRVLNRRGLTVPLYGIDYSGEIIARLSEARADKGIRDIDERVIPKILDIRELSKGLAPNSSGLLILSSVLHEIESEAGWAEVKAVAREQDIVLSEGGIVIVRDFCPPPKIDKEDLQVKFITDEAKAFFKLFVKYYSPRTKPNWENEWDWTNGRSVKMSSRFFFEATQHFRMWDMDYWKKIGREALEETFFRGWSQLREGYILGTKKHDTPSKIIDAFKAAASERGSRYLDKTYLLFDNEYDGLIRANFQYRIKGRQGGADLFPTKRILSVLYKIPKGMGIKEAEKQMGDLDNIFGQVDKERQLTWKMKIS